MSAEHNLIFETQRLRVRTANPADVDLFFALWTDGRVMKQVGFPHGLRLQRAELEQRLSQAGQSEFERCLVVELKATGQPIGECKLARPDAQGVAEPDVKLLPEFWGQRYGAEVWGGLVDYQFTHTDCALVQATPAVSNHASIKMQELHGGVRVGEALYEFPEALREYTTPVRHYIYQLPRSDWVRRREK